MKVFISSLNIPIGYKTPKFPSLYWPLGPTSSQYSTSVLYYQSDVWKFTVAWFMIIFVTFYVVAGFIASLNYVLHYKHNNYVSHNSWIKNYLVNGAVIMSGYILTGASMAFISGSVIGLLTSAIYKAGSMTMSTWIPLVWAIAGIIYDVCSSFSTSSITL